MTVAAGGFVFATGALPAAAATSCGATGTLTSTGVCSYTTSGEDTFTVPAGVTSLHVVADGSVGGTPGPGGAGGAGARVTADIPVTGGSTEYVEVGRGGGAGGTFGGGGGGGLSGIYACSGGGTTAACALLVAGGGGGGGFYGQPGPNGGYGGAGGSGALSCNPGANGIQSHGIQGTSGGGAGGACGAGGAGGAGLPRAGASGGAGTGGAGGAGSNGGAPAGAGGGGGGYYGGGGGGGGNFAGGGYSGGGGGGGGSSFAAASASSLSVGSAPGTPSVTITWTFPDTTPPVLTAPSSVSVQATSAAGAATSYTVSALDETDGPVTPVCDIPSGSTFAIGSTTVTCTATDATGNTSSISFPVRVTIAFVTLSPPVLSTVQTAPFAWTAYTFTRFTCSLDGATFAACSSPRTYNGLAAGPHTFCVMATADVIPSCSSWTIGSPGKPVVSILGVSVVGNAATVSFVSDQLAPRFTCSLDGAAYRSCTAPLTYRGLASGPHTVSVLATNFAGDTSALPAVAFFTV